MFYLLASEWLGTQGCQSFPNHFQDFNAFFDLCVRELIRNKENQRIMGPRVKMSENFINGLKFAVFTCLQ